MQSKAKLLIVEDEGIVALDIRSKLVNIGYSVVGTAGTGEDAIMKARSLCPDLILMDIKLRGEMDGITAAEKIRSKQDIPVIFLTAFADTGTLHRAQQVSPAGYLIKPFEERELAVNVEIALYKHQMDRLLRESEEKWRSLTNNAPNIITIIDQDGNIQYINHSLRSFPANGPQHQNRNIYQFLIPKSQEVARTVIRSVFETGKPGHYEAAIDLPDFGILWYDTQAAPIVIKDQVTAVTLISTNITERITMQRELADALQQKERSNNLLSALGKVAARIQQDADPNTVIDTMGDELKNLGFTSLVMLLNSEQTELVVEYANLAPDLLSQILYLSGNKLIGTKILRKQWKDADAFLRGEPLFLDDPVGDALTALPGIPRYFVKGLFHESKKSPFNALVFLPLISRSRVIGGITILGQDLKREEVPILQLFADQVAITYENASLFKETQRISITDPLTGIHNRRYFLEMAQREHERWTRYQRPYSLLMIDLDHFKQVNDNYGHDMGDVALRVTVETIKQHIRSIDVFGRYGGEEFLVLMPETNRLEAQQMAARLVKNIETQVVRDENVSIHLTASIGVSQVDEGTKTLESLIRRVDQALYLAKNAGRNCVKAL
jgi:diguanylate cyclase (GGDEF)-like protein/PAS domain S-box-containing protein